MAFLNLIFYFSGNKHWFSSLNELDVFRRGGSILPIIPLYLIGEKILSGFEQSSDSDSCILVFQHRKCSGIQNYLEWNSK